MEVLRVERPSREVSRLLDSFSLEIAPILTTLYVHLFFEQKHFFKLKTQSKFFFIFIIHGKTKAKR